MFIRRSLIVLSLLAAMPGASDAQESPGDGVREVLVRLRPGASGASLEALAARLGGSVAKSNHVLGYHKLRVGPNRSPRVELERLKGSPDVLWAEPNGTYSAVTCVDCPQDPYLLSLADALGTGENQWGLFSSGVPWLWRQRGGGSASVIVAVLDTGIDDFGSPHPDLAANVSPVGHDFVDDDASPTDGGAGTLYGHGTHVAGIAAAAANAGGIAGVAYASQVMVVRVLDCAAGSSCPGTFEDIADGIQFAADQGARVINLSLAGPDPSATVRTAIQYAIAAGAIVVAASGNDAASSVSYPARYEEVIAVGAMDASLQVASFSNYGDELDVVAPGVDIWSTTPGPGYAAYQGTSQAAPFVSGVVALMAASSPALTQEEAQSWLRDHALSLAGANALKDGYGRVAFLPLEDWSDLPPPYVVARHQNFLWEWLGFDASAELSISDPVDSDFRPNIGGSHHADGYDDGVFPLSVPKLPILPPHLAGGQTMDYGLQVARFDGPRYGGTPDRQLHLDSWFDWDSDGAFEAGTAAERVVTDHVENPATWGGNTRIVTRPIAPVDEHLLGNPLVVRTRLAYGASAGSPADSARFGEVEDDVLINFVEDFDVTMRVHTSGVYTVMNTWSVVPDPSPPPVCAHRGTWHMASSNHPAVGAPCNGFIESVNVMGTPTMNWTEYTNAQLTFWYCHQAGPCSPAGDFCRVRIDTSGVKHDIGPIPMGSGMLTIDLSAYVGSETVIIEFVEQTDLNGRVAIDDVIVMAFDNQRAATVTGLALSRAAGTRTLDLAWTAPLENHIFPSPPTQGLANLYDIRYSPNPISTEADWNDALRFDPRDVVGGPGGPTPAGPGTAQTGAFRAPSTFQRYFVALKTGDEVTNVSSLSNSPGDSTAATLSVTVLALTDTLATPGDTAWVRYQVTNSGNTPDTYALTAADTQGWPLVGLPATIALAPATSATFVIPVLIPGGAGGEQDTVALSAESMADSTVSHADAGEVEATGTTAVPGTIAASSDPAGLHGVRPNPFRNTLAFELRLEADEHTHAVVYDLNGRRVRELLDGPLRAGPHSFLWDGRDDRGQRAAPGLYFLRVRTPSREDHARLVRVE